MPWASPETRRDRLRLPSPFFLLSSARMRSVSPGIIISRLPGRVLCAPGSGLLLGAVQTVLHTYYAQVTRAGVRRWPALRDSVQYSFLWHSLPATVLQASLLDPCRSHTTTDSVYTHAPLPEHSSTRGNLLNRFRRPPCQHTIPKRFFIGARAQRPSRNLRARLALR